MRAASPFSGLPAERPGNEKRASSRELLILALYFGSVIVLSDILNVRLGVEAMTAIVLVAAVTISRDLRGFARDWWFLLTGLVLWNLGGPIAASSPFSPHLDVMLQADRTLFLGHDPVAIVQHHLASANVGPLDYAAAVSYNLHVPEPYLAGYFLWRLDRLVYLQFAAAALLLLLAGFVTFIVFPVIPPWLAAKQYGKLPGVYNGFGRVLRAYPVPFHGTPLFYLFHLRGDAVAAFPSEHAAFPLLEYLAFSHLNRRLALLLLLWVGWVLVTIVYLGEHWVTDALAGWAYALILFTSVRRLTT